MCMMQDISDVFLDKDFIFFFFFQAEDGIRDAQESRGLGDVYKRQMHIHQSVISHNTGENIFSNADGEASALFYSHIALSLIHI